MNNNLNNIKTIQNQEKIRILFIILNFFALYADKEIEQSLKNSTKRNTNLSNDIYLGITIINIGVLLYYIDINNKGINEAKKKNEDTKLFEIKNIAFTLYIIAVLLFVYVQIENKNNNSNKDYKNMKLQ